MCRNVVVMSVTNHVVIGVLWLRQARVVAWPCGDLLCIRFELCYRNSPCARRFKDCGAGFAILMQFSSEVDSARRLQPGTVRTLVHFHRERHVSQSRCDPFVSPMCGVNDSNHSGVLGR